MPRTGLYWVAVLALAGCDLNPPDVDYRPSEAARAAPFPLLLDRENVLAAAAGPARVAAPVAPLSARVAALRARSAALRGPVLPAAEVERLQAAAR
ncbi:MAG: hypothetical protein AAGE76_04930 [Pseudomonadota bacterium]